MKTISVIRHIEEFKNILLYSKNIGFFFGAGTSCAFGLPNIISLSKDVKEQFSSENQKAFDMITEIVKKVHLKENPTIEDVLNYARQIKDITGGLPDIEYSGITGSTIKALEKDMCDKIYKVISEKENEACFKELRDFFIWYSSYCKGNKKEIFTTNYDMLIEKAMEANFIPYFDGFCGGYEPFFNPDSIDATLVSSDITVDWIRLWKLHGSLNWALKEKTDFSTERIIRIGKVENPSNEIMIYPSREKYNLSRKEPFITYFDKMKKYLRTGELLFITSGYSFLDEHINDVIFGSLQQNNRLYVVVLCYSDEQVEYMQKYSSAYLNLCVMGPKKVILNGVLSEWSFDEEHSDTINTETFWNKANETFTLGDFKKLVEFLIDNSGQTNLNGVDRNEK